MAAVEGQLATEQQDLGDRTWVDILQAEVFTADIMKGRPSNRTKRMN